MKEVVGARRRPLFLLGASSMIVKTSVKVCCEQVRPGPVLVSGGIICE